MYFQVYEFLKHPAFSPPLSGRGPTEVSEEVRRPERPSRLWIRVMYFQVYEFLKHPAISTPSLRERADRGV
jgi:hypothetical protein